MIIENPDIFKSWLTSILEPLCDADPAALAKYVYALVKKDKPVDELRDVMVDQLDVFLQQETKPFVEMLFTSLESQEYLKPGREGEKKQQTPPPELPEAEKQPEENHGVPVPGEDNVCAVGAVSNGAVGAVGARSPRARVVVARAAPRPHPHPPLAHPPHPPLAAQPARAPPQEHTLVKVLPLTELLEEPVDQQPPRRRDRRVDSARDKEERRRRRSRSWERRARARRRDEHRHEHRRSSRSPLPSGRYRNRSPPAPDRQPSRSRSRSPAGTGRGRVLREAERERMSRDREHRDRLSRDRDRDRSRDRSRERSRSVSPRPDQRPDIADAYKRRCRDFDEKGYCMRGDLCQWDHGADPLVLEDAALTRVLSIPPPVPEYNPLTPDIWCGGAAFPPFNPHHNHPPRELIPIPRVRPECPAGPPPAPRHPPLPKKNFEYNRLGHPRPPLSGNVGNCTLEVKKIPRGMNDITHLNNHFCKFGKIVNIQVCYDGDPEAALITFASATDASVAYKSTEAVLNNRFIKVYWHNSENKQENPLPGGGQANKPERHNSQHPMSHNKVLINRDNIKATHETKLNDKEKELANGQEPKKEAVKPVDKMKQVMEMYKRAQALLQKQLQQQKLLIQKLEDGNVAEAQKPVLMEAINSSQEGIEKLRKEVVAYNGIIKQMQGAVKRPKTREEAQKEILDAELDMFNKQQEGQDVTELVKKIAELRRQMAMQFPVHPSIRRPHSRGGRFNTPNRFTRGASKMFSVNQSVDHRPRALLISGFEADELDALLAHFSQFGEVMSKQAELSVPQLVLQYKCRAHAELAAAHGKHYNDRTLSITWVANPSKAVVAEPRAPPAPTRNGEAGSDDNTKEDRVEVSEDALLRFDEEEEEDGDEDRSWRR